MASEARNDTLDASSGHDTSKVLGGTAGNIPQRQTSKLCDSLGRAMQFYCLDKMAEAIGLYDGASAFVVASREVADKRNCLLNDWLAVGVHHIAPSTILTALSSTIAWRMKAMSLAC